MALEFSIASFSLYLLLSKPTEESVWRHQNFKAVGFGRQYPDQRMLSELLHQPNSTVWAETGTAALPLHVCSFTAGTAPASVPACFRSDSKKDEIQAFLMLSFTDSSNERFFFLNCILEWLHVQYFLLLTNSKIPISF